MEQRFTIEQIRNYIKSQDSFGDVMYNLSIANIEKANESDCEELESWFTNLFNELAEEHSNSETIDDVVITNENGIIEIQFSIDCDDRGVHRSNYITINEDNTVNTSLSEIIEGSDLECALEAAIIDYAENGFK